MDYLHGLGSYVIKSSLLSVLNSSLSGLLESPIKSDYIHVETGTTEQLRVRLSYIRLVLPDGIGRCSIQSIAFYGSSSRSGSRAGAKATIRGVQFETYLHLPGPFSATDAMKQHRDDICTERDAVLPPGALAWAGIRHIRTVLEAYAAYFATDLQVECFDISARFAFPLIRYSISQGAHRSIQKVSSRRRTRASEKELAEHVAERRDDQRPADGIGHSASPEAKPGNALVLIVDRIRAIVPRPEAPIAGTAYDGVAGDPGAAAGGDGVAGDAGAAAGGDKDDRYSWAEQGGGTLERTLAFFGVKVGVAVARADADAPPPTADAPPPTADADSAPTAESPTPGGSATQSVVRSRERFIPLLLFAADDSRSSAARDGLGPGAVDSAGGAASAASSEIEARDLGGKVTRVGQASGTESMQYYGGDFLGMGLSGDWTAEGSLAGGVTLGQAAGGGGGFLGGQLEDAMYGDYPGYSVAAKPTERAGFDTWESNFLGEEDAAIRARLYLHAGRSSGETGDEQSTRTRLDVFIDSGGARLIVCPERLAALAPIIATSMLVSPAAFGRVAEAVSVSRRDLLPPTQADEAATPAVPSAKEYHIVEQLIEVAAGADKPEQDVGVSAKPSDGAGAAGVFSTLGWLVGLSTSRPSGGSTEKSSHVQDTSSDETAPTSSKSAEEGGAGLFSFEARPVRTAGSAPVEVDGGAALGAAKQAVVGGAMAPSDGTMTSFMSLGSDTSSFLPPHGLRDPELASKGDSLRRSSVVERSMEKSKLLYQVHHKVLRVDAAVAYLQAVIFTERNAPGAYQDQQRSCVVLSLGNIRTKQSESKQVSTVGIQIGYVELDRDKRSTVDARSRRVEEAVDSGDSDSEDGIDKIVPLGGIRSMESSRDAAFVDISAVRHPSNGEPPVSVDVRFGACQLRLPASSLRTDSTGYGAAFSLIANRGEEAAAMYWEQFAEVLMGGIDVFRLPTGWLSSVESSLPSVGVGIPEAVPPQISIASSSVAIAIIPDEPMASELGISISSFSARNLVLGHLPAVPIAGRGASSSARCRVDSAELWSSAVSSCTALAQWTIDGTEWSLHSTKPGGPAASYVDLLRLVPGSDMTLPGVWIQPEPSSWLVPDRDSHGIAQDGKGSGSESLASTYILYNCRGILAASSPSSGAGASRYDSSVTEQYSNVGSVVRVHVGDACLYIDRVQNSTSLAIYGLVKVFSAPQPQFNNCEALGSDESHESLITESGLTSRSSLILISVLYLKLMHESTPSVYLGTSWFEIFSGSGLEPTVEGRMWYSAVGIWIDCISGDAMKTLKTIRSESLHQLIRAFVPDSPQELDDDRYVETGDGSTVAKSPCSIPRGGDKLTRSTLYVSVGGVDFVLNKYPGVADQISAGAKALDFRMEWNSGKPVEMDASMPELCAQVGDGLSGGQTILRVDWASCELGPPYATSISEQVATTEDLVGSIRQYELRVKIGNCTGSMSPKTLEVVLKAFQAMYLYHPQKQKPPDAGYLESRVASARATYKGRDKYLREFSTIVQLRPTFAGAEGVTTGGGKLAAMPESSIEVYYKISSADAGERLRGALAKPSGFDAHSAVLLAHGKGDSRLAVQQADDSLGLRASGSRGAAVGLHGEIAVLDDFFSDAYVTIEAMDEIPQGGKGTRAGRDEAEGATEETSADSVAKRRGGDMHMSVMLQSTEEQVDLLVDPSAAQSLGGGIGSFEVIQGYMGGSADESSRRAATSGVSARSYESTQLWPSTVDGDVFAAILRNKPKFDVSIVASAETVSFEVVSSSGRKGARFVLTSPAFHGLLQGTTDGESEYGGTPCYCWCGSAYDLSVSAFDGEELNYPLLRMPVEPSASTQALRISFGSLGDDAAVCIQAAPIQLEGYYSSIALMSSVGKEIAGVLAAATAVRTGHQGEDRDGVGRTDAESSGTHEAGSAVSWTMQFVQIYSAPTHVEALYKPMISDEPASGADLLRSGLPAAVDYVARSLSINSLRVPLAKVDWRKFHTPAAASGAGAASKRQEPAEDWIRVAGAQGVAAIVLQTWYEALTAGQVLSAIGALYHPAAPLGSLARIGQAVKSIALLPVDGARVAVRAGGRLMGRALTGGRDNDAVADVRLTNRRRAGGSAMYWGRRAGQAVLGLGRALAVEGLRAASTAAKAIGARATAGETAIRGPSAVHEAGLGRETGDGMTVLAIPVSVNESSSGDAPGTSADGSESSGRLGRAITRAVPVAVLRATAEVSAAVSELTEALHRSMTGPSPAPVVSRQVGWAETDD